VPFCSYTRSEFLIWVPPFQSAWATSIPHRSSSASPLWAEGFLFAKDFSRSFSGRRSRSLVDFSSASVCAACARFGLGLAPVEDISFLRASFSVPEKALARFLSASARSQVSCSRFSADTRSARAKSWVRSLLASWGALAGFRFRWNVPRSAERSRRSVSLLEQRLVSWACCRWFVCEGFYLAYPAAGVCCQRFVHYKFGFLAWFRALQVAR
jgi:hypothetical protein